MNRGKSMHDHQYNGKLLPTHWHQVKLEDVCDMVMGQSPSSSTYNKDGQGLPFLQGKAEFTNLHPIASVYCTDPLKIAKKGSVLISVRAPVGDVNIADQDYIIGRGLGALLLKDGFNPFLFFSLLYNKERLKSQGSGTTFDSITKSTLANFSIFLPPLPEQRAIAYVLQTVQNVIQARRKELALERERKAALMQHLFTHGTRGEATKQTEIGEMPESWEVISLQALCKNNLGIIQTGPFGSQLHANDYIDDGVPVVNPTHLGINTIIEDHLPKISQENAVKLSRHSLVEGDILISRRGDFSRYSYITSKQAGWLCGTGCLLIRLNNPAIDNRFLSISIG